MSVYPIYLDYNATTPIAEPILEVLIDSLKQTFGNASSSHFFGQEAKLAMEKARGQVADLINAKPSTILFTSGGTEADNLALLGATSHTPSDKRHIVTTTIEHPAIAETCAHLESRGFRITRVPCQGDGRVRAADVIEAIDSSTFLVTVMLANNETGALQPVTAIGEHCRKNGILMHTDAAQAVGKIHVDVEALNVDMLTIAGHKLYAPKGIGALYVGEGVSLTPIQFGGGHEMGLRPGTENVPLVAALGKAAELASDEMEFRMRHSRELCAHLWRRLESALGTIQLNGSFEHRLPNTLNISIPGVRSSELMAMIEDVALSAGSACHEGESEPSPVLTAMGLPVDRALGALRISVGRDSSQSGLDHAADSLIKAVRSLQQGG